MSADGGAAAVEVPGKFVDAGTFAVASSNLPDFIVCEIFLLLLYLGDDINRVVGSVGDIDADLRKMTAMNDLEGCDSFIAGNSWQNDGQVVHSGKFLAFRATFLDRAPPCACRGRHPRGAGRPW